MGIKKQRLTFNKWVECTDIGIPSPDNPLKLLTYQEFMVDIKELAHVYKPLKNR